MIGAPGPLPRSRLHQPLPAQDPVDRRRRRHLRPARHSAACQAGPTQQLHPDPFRSPPRMLPAQLDHHPLDLPRRLVRTRPRPGRPIGQPTDPLTQIPPQPRMHRLSRHPNLSRNLGHRSPRQHRPNRIQPLLDHRQHNQRQSRPPESDDIAEHRRPTGRTRGKVSSTYRHTSVKHLPGQDRFQRPPSAEFDSQRSRRARRPLRVSSLRCGPLRGGPT